jgi:predicted enzyme related to lactoylglutathione lyase
MFQGVVEVMYFVPDRKVAANWYSQLLDLPITYLDEPEHYFICTGAQDIWFSLADSKVPNGAAGHVAYWRVQDSNAARARSDEMGAQLHRGPLDRGDGEFMCQMKDPFGNLFGLVGPSMNQTD